MIKIFNFSTYLNNFTYFCSMILRNFNNINMSKTMKRKSFYVLLASVMLAAMNLASCKMSDNAAETSRIGEIPEAAQFIVGIEKYDTLIDYSLADNWLDVPASMVQDGELNADAAEGLKDVDVFYVYPTVTGFRPETEVCEMTDTMMISGAQMVRQIQTAVFDESCNVFMPYYRQISMPKPGSDYQAIINYVSGFDATDALDYYLTHLNQGRPFIIAGHSQGAATVIALLENHLTKHPEALSRMVAAYPIGFAVTKDWLAKTGLKFAEGATDTGVIVSWNTEGPSNQNEKNMTLAPGGISINPINWKRDDTYAPVEENLGSLTYDGQLVVPGIADARVDTARGSVVVSTIAEPVLYAIPGEAAQMFGPESYHLHDYGFFFNNFKQNVADRIKAFMEK